MSLFGSSIKYSTVEHQLSEFDIKKLVSHYKVKSLDSTEEGLVEQTIVARRLGNGKISLQQVYETLTQLKNQNKISRVDRDGVMRVFSEYFG
ncbi:MAG: hypothetical protein ABIJ23_00485 [Candidatus Magasanikbacteria bacterium]